MSGNSPLGQLLDIYSLVVLARVMISWLQLPPNNPVVYYSRKLTEPALAPIRRLIPPAGGIDFSPLLLLLVCRMLRGIF